jgi:hypothetical protein
MGLTQLIGACLGWKFLGWSNRKFWCKWGPEYFRPKYPTKCLVPLTAWSTTWSWQNLENIRDLGQHIPVLRGHNIRAYFLKLQRPSSSFAYMLLHCPSVLEVQTWWCTRHMHEVAFHGVSKSHVKRSKFTSCWRDSALARVMSLLGGLCGVEMDTSVWRDVSRWHNMNDVCLQEKVTKRTIILEQES